MNIKFNCLEFFIKDEKVLLLRCGNIYNKDGYGFVEVQISGEEKRGHLGTKMICSSEGARLRYVSHEISDNKLIIVQKSDLTEVKTEFSAYDDCNAVRIQTEAKNISEKPFTIEEISAFSAVGIGDNNGCSDSLYFTEFTQSHHCECQPVTESFSRLGLFRVRSESQKRIAFANVGSWSTKERLPQGIIEDRGNNEFTMFQIESNNSWYYEIADFQNKLYLYLGGANLPYGGWQKRLEPNGSYRTVAVSVSFGKSLNQVISEMTKYRRHICGRCAADETLPGVFNEYMHLSWDNPTEFTTRKYAPAAAKAGAEYYVIDCGWHDEEDGNIIYPYVGKWLESKKRFPSGVRKTLDYIRSLGMKPGLWIEPEVVGCKCSEMIGYYGDDCFLQRNGKRLCVMGRHFLDFRNSRVCSYMNETIRRMVEDYGAEYIKFDYNQDCGVGTDFRSDSFGEGLEQAAQAYLKWVDGVRAAFPNVVFETCSSGGMRLDYLTLSHFSTASTSDQVDYKKYPYIAGNILSAVLPEQAAVWSYPVDCLSEGEKPFEPDGEYVKKTVTDEKIIMNMVNCLLGRMHLASHIELLSDAQTELIKEGIRYYNKIADEKKKAAPYFPIGFTRFGEKQVASGLKTDGKIFLAVWNLGGKDKMEIPLNGISAEKAYISYPLNAESHYSLENNTLSVAFTEQFQARMFEIEIQ